MTDNNTKTDGLSDEAAMDVFAAARWFAELWNCTAKAVAPDEIEWQCTTWGSGRGFGDWTETAIFVLVAQLFGLPSGRNYDARDELLVWVPLDRVPSIVRLVDRLGQDPEAWPWLREEDRNRQVTIAADLLGVPASTMAGDDDLLEALRIE
jgi:hypothetical protein